MNDILNITIETMKTSFKRHLAAELDDLLFKINNNLHSLKILFKSAASALKHELLVLMN